MPKTYPIRQGIFSLDYKFNNMVSTGNGAKACLARRRQISPIEIHCLHRLFVYKTSASPKVRRFGPCLEKS